MSLKSFSLRAATILRRLRATICYTLRIRAVASYISFFYPVYWFATFLVRALPVLLHTIFLGHRLAVFSASFLSVWAACLPPNHTDRGSPLMVAGIVLATAFLCTFLLRHDRVLGGMLIASVAHAALIEPLMRAPVNAATAILYFAVMVWGFRWMAIGIQNLALVFLLPLTLFESFHLLYGAPAQYLLLLVLPAAIGAALAGIRVRPLQNAAFARPWKTIAAGLTASLLLAGAVHAGNLAKQRARSAALRASLAAVPKIQMPADYPKLFFQKGVNFTAEQPGGYSPEVAGKMLDQLVQQGVNAIALVPYGMSRKNDPTIRFGGGWERAELLAAITTLAHLRGMKVLLKPQIWVGRGFPGDIDFASSEDRNQWFQQYRSFIESYARLAAGTHADLFCVGVEFARMSRYDAEWRNLIAAVRTTYPGPLVYAAIQGPEFEGIAFWDALDYIGLNNYYPLPDDLSMDAIVQKVETVQRKFGRPVIFTEAGFSSFKAPHKAPWDETRRELAPAEQARCYEAVFRAFYRKPWFQGVYWWKVGTNGFGGPNDGSLTPWGKPAMAVVARWYLQGGR